MNVLYHICTSASYCMGMKTSCNYCHRWLKKLATLLLQLLQRPDLARHVRRWTFHSSRISELQDHRIRKMSGMNNVRGSRVLVKAIKASNHSEEEETKWLKDTKCRDHRDAILALVLSILVKLQILDMQLMPWVPEVEKISYLERMMHRAGRGEKSFDVNPAFHALTKIMYKRANKKCGVSQRYIILSMSFPSIHAIYGHCIGTPLARAKALLCCLQLHLHSNILSSETAN